MDKILHDPKDPRLWEIWSIPYYGSCRILSISSMNPKRVSGKDRPVNPALHRRGVCLRFVAELSPQSLRTAWDFYRVDGVVCFFWAVQALSGRQRARKLSRV